MTLIEKLEKKISWIAIPNLTFYLIGVQVIGFFLITLNPQNTQLYEYSGSMLLRGEWWRLASYLMKPVSQNILFLGLAMYIYYLYGMALERVWGTFRYTLFILIGFISTLIFSFIFPFTWISNTFIFTSLFLAFAYLFPNFTLMIFFILPVKVKWIALITWIGLLVSIIVSPAETKLLTVASLSNFFLFFGHDLWYRMRSLIQGKTETVRTKIIKSKPDHVCATCHKNNIDNPEMGIRYCNTCIPSTCYCEEYIHDHPHIS